MSVWGQLIAKQPNVLFARGLQNDRVHKEWTTKVYKQSNDHVSTDYILCLLLCFAMRYEWDLCLNSYVFLCICKYISFLSSDRIYFLLQIKEIKSSIVE